MAQIDELIAAMIARRADALILNSDQPAQLNFGGNLAGGALVPAYLLNAMLAEIVPATQVKQLYAPGEWALSYNSPNGLMEVAVTRYQDAFGTTLKLIVVPRIQTHNIFTPPVTPATTFQTYKPPVDSSFAPPTAPPSFNAAPIPGYSVPMVTSQNTPQANTPYPNTAYVPTTRTSPAPLVPAKPRVEFFTVLSLLIAFWVLSSAVFSFAPFPPLWMIFLPAIAGSPVVVAFALAILSALGVLVDARALGVRRGLVEGFGNMDAQGWFFTTFLLGALGVPLYLAARPTYKRALQEHSNAKRLKP